MCIRDSPSDDGRRRGRQALFWALFLVITSWHAWNVAVGAWSTQQHLPLHLCSLSGIVLLYMLATRDYRPSEIVFFIGIIGASQTLITPEAQNFGLPHFRALQTLAGHGLIVIALVFITTIEGMRPTWSSVWKTMVALNVYLVVITPINYLLGSNYMYTLQKPASASLLDLLGPWPWYLFWCEFVALGLCALIYLPFAIADRRAAH